MTTYFQLAGGCFNFSRHNFSLLVLLHCTNIKPIAEVLLPHPPSPPFLSFCLVSRRYQGPSQPKFPMKQKEIQGMSFRQPVSLSLLPHVRGNIYSVCYSLALWITRPSLLSFAMRDESSFSEKLILK